jgi:hypothetical protein
MKKRTAAKAEAKATVVIGRVAMVRAPSLLRVSILPPPAGSLGPFGFRNMMHDPALFFQQESKGSGPAWKRPLIFRIPVCGGTLSG